MHFLIAPIAICFPEAYSFFVSNQSKILLIYIPLIFFFMKDIIYLNVGFIDHFLLVEDRKLIIKNTLKKLFPLEIITLFFEIVGLGI